MEPSVVRHRLRNLEPSMPSGCGSRSLRQPVVRSGDSQGKTLLLKSFLVLKSSLWKVTDGGVAKAENLNLDVFDADRLDRIRQFDCIPGC